MGKIHNFYAGPSIIHPTVIQQATEFIQQTDEQLSILEISHRTPTFGAIMEEAVALAKELLQLNNEFELIFLQGGGRQQFYQIPFNFSQVFKTAYYVNTGTWANGAMQEANYFGPVKEIATSEQDGYTYIPEIPSELEKASYLYICTNNTIFGTEYQELPTINAPLVADMSSDLFSRKLDFNKFGLFFSATQKNAGTAGACLVAVNKNMFVKERGSLPTMIDYRTHIDKKSLYQTPPVFAIVMSLLTFRWIKQSGGIEFFEQENTKKANLLYGEIDRNELFDGYADERYRSKMNAVFTMKNSSLEAKFLNFAEENGIVGINGHRSIGGFRASMYNALPLESVQVLVDVMKEFERTI